SGSGWTRPYCLRTRTLPLCPSSAFAAFRKSAGWLGPRMMRSLFALLFSARQQILEGRSTGGSHVMLPVSTSQRRLVMAQSMARFTRAVASGPASIRLIRSPENASKPAVSPLPCSALARSIRPPSGEATPSRGPLPFSKHAIFISPPLQGIRPRDTASACTRAPGNENLEEIPVSTIEIISQQDGRRRELEERGSTGGQRRRSFANVTAIERVLTVLEAINRMPTITVKRISSECDVPAATVVRILETLCAQGYLVHLSRRAGYSLTSRVKALSAGYHGPPMIVERLSKYVDALTMQHLWPFSIATLEHDVMVIQYTAMELSPLSHVRTTLHRRLSLVGRAYGIAYLAFCSSIERHHLARIIFSQDYP